MHEDLSTIELDPRFADLVVSCPVPGQEDEPAQRLGDFARTERGQKVVRPLLENIAFLEKSGIDSDKAIVIAFAGGVAMTEDGQFLRRPAEKEQAPQQLEIADQGAKKK